MLRITRGIPIVTAVLHIHLGRLSWSSSLNPLVVRRNMRRGIPDIPPTVTPLFRHASLSLKGKRRMEYRPINAAAMSSQSVNSSCNSKLKNPASSGQSDIMYPTPYI
jgi:hypothetical protein